MVAHATTAQRIEAKTRADLRTWLEANHANAKGVWLVTYKKGSKFYLPYDALVEECLCFGWIDSLPRALDAARSMHYIAPRKPGSAWSRLNKERAAQLTRNGLMQDAGLAGITQAKSDGSWTFLDDVEDGIVPDDLAEALDVLPHARTNFDNFPPSSRRLILEWIKQARKPETREKRISETAEKAEQNVRANHYR